MPALVSVALLLVASLAWSWGNAALVFCAFLVLACFKRWTLRLPALLPEVPFFVGSVAVSVFLGRDFRLSYNPGALIVSYLFLWLLIFAFQKHLTTSRFFVSVAFVFLIHAVEAVREIWKWYVSWLDVSTSFYPFQSSLLRLSTVRNWPNEYAIFLIISIPLLVYAAQLLKKEGREGICRRRILGAFSAFGVLLLLFTRSRVGLLGLGVEATLAIALFSPSRRILLRWGVFLVACLCLSLGDDALAGSFHAAGIFDSWKMTHSLTPFLGLMIALLAGIMFLPKISMPQSPRFKRLLPYEISLLCLGFPLFLGIWRAVPIVAGFKSGDSLDSGRTQLWSVALGNFLDAPWFGQGPGCFGLAWAQTHDTSNSWIAMHAHNISLELLSSFGILGFAAALFLLAGFFKLILPLQHQESRILLCIALGLVAAFAFDSPFTSPANVALILLTVAWGLDFGRILPLRCLQLGPMHFPLVLVPFLMLYWAIGLHPGLVDFERSRESRSQMALDSAALQSARAVVQEPGNALLWRERGRTLAQQGDLRAAGAALDSALKYEPSHGATWLNLAWIRLQMRDTVGAIKVLDRSGVRTDVAFHGVPRIWRGVLSGRIGSADFDSVTKTFALFPFTSICRSSNVCKEWGSGYLTRDSNWVALRSEQDAKHVRGAILEYVAHIRFGHLKEAAWLRKAVQNEPIYDYSLTAVDGQVQMPRLFRLSHNGIYLQGYDAQEQILFDEVAMLFAVSLH